LQVSSDEEALLDRGGRPTLRELLRLLVFSPSSGSIRLNKERLILQRASQTSNLRDQLVERYGRDDAFVMLTRLGFCSGAEDADFVRKSWPGLDPGDVFTAGTRLHMLCGCVRLKTVHNDFDFRKGKFSGNSFGMAARRRRNIAKGMARPQRPCAGLRSATRPAMPPAALDGLSFTRNSSALAWSMIAAG